MIKRRRFVEGLALAADTAGFGRARPARAATIDLTVGTLPVNLAGRARTATVVNGALPGPSLRLREGDTATISVRNTLGEPTSVHWHGILLPNAMDGVPGLTFRGIPPGE